MKNQLDEADLAIHSAFKSQIFRHADHPNVYAKEHAQAASEALSKEDFNGAATHLKFAKMWAQDHDKIKSGADLLLKSKNPEAVSHAKEALHHLINNYDHVAAQKHLDLASMYHDGGIKPKTPRIDNMMPPKNNVTPLRGGVYMPTMNDIRLKENNESNPESMADYHHSEVKPSKTGEIYAKSKGATTASVKPTGTETKVGAGKTGEVYTGKLAESSLVSKGYRLSGSYSGLSIFEHSDSNKKNHFYVVSEDTNQVLRIEGRPTALKLDQVINEGLLQGIKKAAVPLALGASLTGAALSGAQVHNQNMQHGYNPTSVSISSPSSAVKSGGGSSGAVKTTAANPSKAGSGSSGSVTLPNKSTMKYSIPLPNTGTKLNGPLNLDSKFQKHTIPTPTRESYNLDEISSKLAYRAAGLAREKGDSADFELTGNDGKMHPITKAYYNQADRLKAGGDAKLRKEREQKFQQGPNALSQAKMRGLNKENFNNVTSNRNFELESSILEVMKKSCDKNKMMENAMNIQIATPEQRDDWLNVGRGAMDVVDYINKYKV